MRRCDFGFRRPWLANRFFLVLIRIAGCDRSGMLLLLFAGFVLIGRVAVGVHEDDLHRIGHPWEVCVLADGGTQVGRY